MYGWWRERQKSRACELGYYLCIHLLPSTWKGMSQCAWHRGNSPSMRNAYDCLFCTRFPLERCMLAIDRQFIQLNISPKLMSMPPPLDSNGNTPIEKLTVLSSYLHWILSDDFNLGGFGVYQEKTNNQRGNISRDRL